MSSYHITLLTGEIGQSDTEFYIMSSIYIATSLFWWFLFCTHKSYYVLAAPFIFYGLAFFFLALAPLLRLAKSTRWVQYIATAHYAAASSSGGLYFALNFGNERLWPPSWRNLGATHLINLQVAYPLLSGASKRASSKVVNKCTSSCSGTGDFESETFSRPRPWFQRQRVRV